MTRIGQAPHRRLLGLVVVSLSLLTAAALGQVSIRVPQAVPEVDTVLTEGRELETQRRWGEVVTLYEEASRRNPGQHALEQRLDLAKVHYDIGRRYSDSTYRQQLMKLSEQQALDVYSQVTSRLFTHYVQPPNWKALVDRGTMSLNVAMYETPFIDEHLKNIGSEAISNFRSLLQQELSKRQIRDRNQARDAVQYAARLAHTHLKVRPAAVVFEYICGALGGLDEYSTFLTAAQLTDIYSQIDGNFVGLGVELKAHEHALLIVNVIPGSPAAKAGIKKADRLTSVAGRTTHDLTTDQAADLLQGEVGTTVELVSVTGDERPRRLVVRRDHVDVPSIEDAKLLDPEAGVAYLKLSVFQKTTAKDLDTALWKLYREGMKSLVMDLRGNPGGLLTSSVEVADKFLEQGSIVSTRGRSPQEDFNYSAQKQGTWRVPLVVLLDGDSASASEIFAGAMRDHRRATIVGTRSYGKGSVQGIFPLTVGNTGVRLTTAKFYSPNGHPYSRVGVEPDIYVRSAEKPILSILKNEVDVDELLSEDKDDPTLAAGLQAARKQLASLTK